ncbi:hypothetical protein QC760_010623 [Botrytis cinerea]
MPSTKANLDLNQRSSRFSTNSRSDHVFSNSNKRPSSPPMVLEHPIIIDDDTEPKINMEASPQKRQRTNHHLDESVCLASKELSDVDWLLRFSQRIVVISGAGISAKAGCELSLGIVMHNINLSKFLPFKKCGSASKPFTNPYTLPRTK